MTRCLSDPEIQSFIDGEASGARQRHVAECEACTARARARSEAVEPLLAAAESEDLPPTRRAALRATLSERPVSGATTLRHVPTTPRWMWAGGLAAISAGLLVFVVMPAVDRRTGVSAAEILDRSQTTLAAPLSGIEMLTYDLSLEGVLGEFLPEEQAGRFTVQETIDHDHSGRYRLVKLHADGTIVAGAADDPTQSLRLRYLRANGRGYLLRFVASQPVPFSLPAIRRAVLQTFITLMQTSTGNRMSEVQRDGESCYVVEATQKLGAGELVKLSRATAIVTVADARLVEFSASGSVAGRPFTIEFALRDREMRASGSAGGTDFTIEPQPGDLVLQGDGSTNPLWDVIARVLAEVPEARR